MSTADHVPSVPGESPRVTADWWKTLSEQNRAARARLRRATVSEAACDEATLDLCRRLGLGWPALPKVARLACVLAHVRENDPRPFAQAIGRAAAGDADSAALSPLRFRHLLTATEDDDIVRGFRRAVAIAGGRANVRDLFYLLMGWEQDRTRTRFAFDYYTPDRSSGPDRPAEKGSAA